MYGPSQQGNSLMKTGVIAVLVGALAGVAGLSHAGLILVMLCVGFIASLLIPPKYLLALAIWTSGSPELFGISYKGFHISISELMQFLFILSFLLKKKRIIAANGSWKSPPGMRTYVLFGVLLVSSLVVGHYQASAPVVTVQGLKTPFIYGLVEITWYLESILFYVLGFIMVQSLERSERLRFVDVLLLISGVWVLVGIFTSTVAALPGEVVSKMYVAGHLLTRVNAFEDEPSMFAAYITPLVPLALWRYSLAKRRIWMVLTGVLLVGIATAMSTTGFIGLIILLIAFLVWPDSRRKVARKVIVFLTALSVLAVALLTIPSLHVILTQQVAKLSHPSSSYSSNYRLAILLAGVHLFLSHPLFGSGTGTLQFELYNNVPAAFIGVVKDKLNAANDVYVDILAEYGIFTFVAAISFCIAILRKIKRNPYLLVSLLTLLIQFAAIDNFFRVEFWCQLVVLLAINLDYPSREIGNADEGGESQHGSQTSPRSVTHQTGWCP